MEPCRHQISLKVVSVVIPLIAIPIKRQSKFGGIADTNFLRDLVPIRFYIYLVSCLVAFLISFWLSFLNEIGRSVSTFFLHALSFSCLHLKK